MLFKGVATALVTPMSEDKINYDKLCELINWQIEKGINAIVLLGTTGEAPTISVEEKSEILRLGVQAAEGRVPVIAGCGSNDTALSIRLCENAQKAGVDGFLINNPYYNKSSDNGIYAHYKAISDAVDKPIIVYNVPGRTGKNLSAELMIRLCEIENVKGFKEASGDISQIVKLCAGKPEDILVYSGSDDMILPVMAIGGSGVICTCSNIAPKMCLDITDAYFANDFETAKRKQFELLKLFDAMFCDCNPIPVKTAMNMAGFGVGKMRLPLVELDEEKKKKVAKVLEEFDIHM